MGAARRIADRRVAVRLMAPRLHFTAADTEEGRVARDLHVERYGQAPADQADIIVPLGGDGTMLEAIHACHRFGKPFYGMNRGTVGFMLNDYATDNLEARLAAAYPMTLRPLQMAATTATGDMVEALAFNEVSLMRQMHNAAKISILLDGVERMAELVCDGILVSTPAGSTAYNLSAHGPIIPLKANILALTPISAFRPRRWRGAILPNHAKIRFDIREADKRPVSATADFTEVRDVVRVDVVQNVDVTVNLLFDPGHTLEERIMKEQFLT